MLDFIGFLSLVGVIAVSGNGIRNDLAESKFQKEFDEKAWKLIEYYQKKGGLAIVGFNDSQGVNTTSTFFKQGLLETIATNLTSDQLNPQIINAFSLTMNKTEHIDYFLENNLSLEEIKLSQVYSAISALEKVMTDIGLPKRLGAVANLYRLIYKSKKGDEQIFLTDTLREYEEPVVIYSSGVNNLMRSVGNNPFSIESDYKARDKRPNFNYTLAKSQDPLVLAEVLDGIKYNFEHLLAINNKADIYALGSYVPASLRKEEMNVFRELVIQYNEELKQLCQSYQLSFVDTEQIGEKYNHSMLNFHISSEGHHQLANHILNRIYHNKIEEPMNREVFPNQNFDEPCLGAQGMIEAVEKDYEASLRKARDLDGYDRKREHAISQEHLRESEIFEKVLMKTRK